MQNHSISDDALSKTASDQQPGPAQPQPTPDPDRIDKTAPRININPDNVKSRDSIKKAYLNAVVMGHVGCGKSTVSGRLVYECDGIDEDLMTKFEREANQVTGTLIQTTFFKRVSIARNCHIHRSQTNPRHQEEKTPGFKDTRIQSNQPALPLPQWGDCKKKKQDKKKHFYIACEYYISFLLVADTSGYF